MRALILIALAYVMLWLAYELFRRIVLAGLVVLMLTLASGCTFYNPARPELHYCYPAHNWRCDPRVKWSDM